MHGIALALLLAFLQSAPAPGRLVDAGGHPAIRDVIAKARASR
jgi:hypothetical protein